MVKRTVEISGESSPEPVRLNVEHDQLVITRGKTETGRVPIEDVGYLILDQKALSLTHSVLTRILHHGGVVLVCDDTHTPAGLMISMHDNDLTARRMRQQVEMSQPRRKRLWQQIVRHKVIGQALNLPDDHAERRRLIAMAQDVKSGDTSNIEGQAARFYWPALLGVDFRRDPDGLPPNGLLNYGYMVLRAACARAIVAAGLHPVFSLQHVHRNNTFALADDLVELFRPRVDRAVKMLVDQGTTEIGRDAKRALLGLLGEPIVVGGAAGPMMVQLGRVVTSLVECVEGSRTTLELPGQTLKGINLLPEKFDDEPENDE
jgi:CRISPR-associated protein Cas1